MIKGISCIEVPVSDMARSVDFYENVLDLKKTYEHPVWTSFDIGGTSFAVATSGTKGKQDGTEPCRSCHLCVLRFGAGNIKQAKEAPAATSVIYLAVEDLDSTYRRLKEKGVEFIGEPKPQAWGGKTAPMLDPDKNILVLAQYE